jgi:hypothetical protein
MKPADEIYMPEEWPCRMRPYAVESQIVEYTQTFRRFNEKSAEAVDSYPGFSTIKMWKIGIKSSYTQSYPHYPQFFIQIFQIDIRIFETGVL